MPQTTIKKRKPRNLNKLIGGKIKNYDAEFGCEACISSILRAWAKTNKVSTRQLEQAQNISIALAHEPAGTLEEELLTSLPSFDLKTAEITFENLIDVERKQKEGVVYTPDYIIDYIINYCLNGANSKNLPTLIDHACGSGGFLVRGAHILKETFRMPIERLIEECLFGADVNHNAVRFTKIALELMCLQEGVKPKGLNLNVIQADTLQTPAAELLQLFGLDREGFDIVATNPPYVKLQNLDQSYRTVLMNKYPEFTQGSYSLAMLFLIAGYRLLNSGGTLGYITQNNLFTSLAAANIRDFLQKKRCLNTIIDFGHKKVFDGASAYTCLLFLDREEKEVFKFHRTTDPINSLPKLRSKDLDEIDISKLKKDKWRLAAPNHLANLTKLENEGTPLGCLAEIRVGFATLKDSVFLFDRGKFDIESEICKPAIKIADFSNEFELNNNQKQIIHPYKKIGNRWLAFSEDEISEKFPKAYQHFQSHKEELLKRSQGNDPKLKYYEWGRTQGMEAKGPKLLTKTFNRGPNFLLDTTDSLFCNGYSIKPLESGSLHFEPIKINVLQKVLNSPIMDYYTKLTSFQIEGNYQCFQKNFIERFCLPPLSEDTQKRIAELDGEELHEFLSELFGIELDEIQEIVTN